MRVQAALGFEVLWSADDSPQPAWRWAGAVGSRTGLKYLYLPHGPTCAAANLTTALSAARAAGNERGMDFVRVEPTARDSGPALAAAGGCAAPAIQPLHTWILDLDADEPALRSQLSSGHRGSINAAERRGLSFRSSTDPADAEIFISLVHQTGVGRFHPQSDGYYRTLLCVLMPLGAASLHVAEAGGKAVAAAIGFDFGDTRCYAHAAADPSARKLSAAAPLVWHMILEARARGRSHFDFWGVLADVQPEHPWSGLSQFKKSFGGRLVSRSGTWELPVHPLRYRAYTLLRRLLRDRSPSG